MPIYVFSCMGTKPWRRDSLNLSGSLSGSEETIFHLIVLVFPCPSLRNTMCFVRCAPNPYLSLMIYLGFWFLSYEMNGIRQGLALGFIGVAVYHAWKGRCSFMDIYRVSHIGS